MSEPDTKPKMQVVSIDMVREELREIVRSELAAERGWLVIFLRDVLKYAAGILKPPRNDGDHNPPSKQ